MYTLAGLKNSPDWGDYLLVILYTIFMLFVQAVIFCRLPYPALRADVLLPVIFIAAVEWPVIPALLWACFWGFVLDTLSGMFWGFHISSYVGVVGLVNIAGDKLEVRNPVYRTAFIGLCALAQSLALGLYFTLSASEPPSQWNLWANLVIRAIFIMTLSPFILYPVCWGGFGTE